MRRRMISPRPRRRLRSDGPARCCDRRAERLYRGIWPTYFAAPFCTAAAAARLLRFDGTQTCERGLNRADHGGAGRPAIAAATTVALARCRPRGRPRLAGGAFGRGGVHLRPEDRRWRFPEEHFRHLHRCACWAAGRRAASEPDLVQAMVRGAPDHGGDPGVEGNPRGGCRAGLDPRIGVAVLPPHLQSITVSPPGKLFDLTSLQYQMAVAALRRVRLTTLSGRAAARRCRPSWRGSRCAPRKDCSRQAVRSSTRGFGPPMSLSPRLGRGERTVTARTGRSGPPFDQSDLEAKFVRVAPPMLDRERAEAEFAAASPPSSAQPRSFVRLGRSGRRPDRYCSP